MKGAAVVGKDAIVRARLHKGDCAAGPFLYNGAATRAVGQRAIPTVGEVVVAVHAVIIALRVGDVESAPGSAGVSVRSPIWGSGGVI